MAGARIPGPLGRAGAIDAGTLTRARVLIPGPLSDISTAVEDDDEATHDADAIAAISATPPLRRAPAAADRTATVNAAFMDTHWKSARGSRQRATRSSQVLRKSAA
jgi:hypothetical protein